MSEQLAADQGNVRIKPDAKVCRIMFGIWAAHICPVRGKVKGCRSGRRMRRLELASGLHNEPRTAAFAGWSIRLGVDICFYLCIDMTLHVSFSGARVFSPAKEIRTGADGDASCASARLRPEFAEVALGELNVGKAGV